MFSFFATIISAAWIAQHINEILIGLAILVLIIILSARRKRKRRAAYLALPVQFIGNKATKTYHAAGCPQLPKILPENRIAFRLPAETARLGYRPCGTCSPRWPQE